MITNRPFWKPLLALMISCIQFPQWNKEDQECSRSPRGCRQTAQETPNLFYPKHSKMQLDLKGRQGYNINSLYFLNIRRH